MDSARQLGFEVHIYARVPDMGDGADRVRSVTASGTPSDREKDKAFRGGHSRSISTGSVTGVVPMKKHARKKSGNTSTESDQGSAPNSAAAFSRAFVKSLGGTPGAATPSSVPAHGNLVASASPSTGKIRYREQGVDELLQLKLHQAIASVDGPPPTGSTIVLATGDGNVGQFNEDGFLGVVRTALKKGWKVELYAWEDGLSRSWRREFGQGSEWCSDFRVIGLEQFAQDLVELYF
jgi:hypothetical protein